MVLIENTPQLPLLVSKLSINLWIRPRPVITSVLYLEVLLKTNSEEVCALPNQSLWKLEEILKEKFMFLKLMKEEDQNHSLPVTDHKLSLEPQIALLMLLYQKMLKWLCQEII